jgi:hypothetical protein
MRAELRSNRPTFTNLRAQQPLDEWVEYYNTARRHQSLDMATPAQRFSPGAAASPSTDASGPQHDRTGDDWVSRRVTTNGVVCVAWQRVSVGRHYAGACSDVHVDGELLRFRIGD